jgi:ABC-type transport system involved in cytochrome bd biosynthesis fused ATPase/permease subunit
MVNKKAPPVEAANFYHPIRPLTAGFHVALMNVRLARRTFRNVADLA